MTEYIEIPTIGEFLENEFMKPLGLSQNALAKALAIPQNRISDIINGKRGISADTDLRLCRYFRMSEGFFSRVQESFERRLTKQKIAAELVRIKPIKTNRISAKVAAH